MRLKSGSIGSRMHFIHRVLEPPAGSFFLFGPRGTGKTTWLKRQYPSALWINLLQPEELMYYSASPEKLKDVILANPNAKTVIIDEVQKVPILLSLVHSIIEEKRGIQFILTGSSARKLKRAGVDLLAGRAILKKMHPFAAFELKDEFQLDQALKIGLLPLVWEAENPLATINTYAALYLKEEVQEEGIVRRVGDFARFLKVMSFSHASLLNTANIARECSVSRKTVDSYLQILEDLMLSFTLHVFTKKAQRALSAHAKFYFFDAGVFRSLRAKNPMDRSEEIDGAALEGLVAHHLKFWLDHQEDSWELEFWRTRSGVEVDFVLYGPTGFWAIEVKNNSTLSPSDTRGLEEFQKDYPQCKTLLLYRGTRRVMQNNVLCIPCEEFLRNMNPKQPLF